MNVIIFAFALSACSCFSPSEAASDISASSDDCVTFDSCRTGEKLFRTCSCDRECAVYGTCCSDSDYARKMAPKMKFRCNSDRTITPVYAKKACLDSFVAHPGPRDMCEGAEHDDKADVLGNVLVTSVRTRVTYWNRDCGICNNENPEDLILWTIRVTCPSKHGSTRFNQNYIERHLHFDRDIDEWGLKVEDGFKTCALSFAQPRKMAGKLSYCAPNLVSRCPIEYPKKGVVEKCHAYHAERRRKGEDTVYYRNAHCALCNGIGEEELECVGRVYGSVGVAGERNRVMVSFDQEWLDREGAEKYKCSINNTWDPFNLRCRKLPLELWKELTAKRTATSHAHKTTFHSCLFVIIAIAFYNKYTLK